MTLGNGYSACMFDSSNRGFKRIYQNKAFIIVMDFVKKKKKNLVTHTNTLLHNFFARSVSVSCELKKNVDLCVSDRQLFTKICHIRVVVKICGIICDPRTILLLMKTFRWLLKCIYFFIK